MNSRTLLDSKEAALAGADFSAVDKPKICGWFEKVSISRRALTADRKPYLRLDTSFTSKKWFRVTYNNAQAKRDLFSSFFLLKRISDGQCKEIKETVKQIKNGAIENDLKFNASHKFWEIFIIT